MEVGDEKEGEESNRLFLPLEELWKQKTKGKKTIRMDFSSYLNNDGSMRREGRKRAERTFPLA